MSTTRVIDTSLPLNTVRDMTVNLTEQDWAARVGGSDHMMDQLQQNTSSLQRMESHELRFRRWTVTFTITKRQNVKLHSFSVKFGADNVGRDLLICKLIIYNMEWLILPIFPPDFIWPPKAGLESRPRSPRDCSEDYTIHHNWNQNVWLNKFQLAWRRINFIPIIVI